MQPSGVSLFKLRVQSYGLADGTLEASDLSKPWSIPINGNLTLFERHVVHAADRRA
jgi:hypothetical protein